MRLPTLWNLFPNRGLLHRLNQLDRPELDHRTGSRDRNVSVSTPYLIRCRIFDWSRAEHLEQNHDHQHILLIYRIALLDYISCCCRILTTWIFTWIIRRNWISITICVYLSCATFAPGTTSDGGVTTLCSWNQVNGSLSRSRPR